MERIGAMKELAALSRGPQPTGLILPPSLDADTGLALSQLMAQTMARYSNQVLTGLTQEMYLTEWEEMVVRYTLKNFTDALSRAIRDSKFFPSPDAIREICVAANAEAVSRREAARVIAEHDAAKALWERERAEDIANGIPRGSAESELDGVTAPKGYRAVPRYPQTPVAASGDSWRRAGFESEEAYEADCAHKRGLIESEKRVAA